jgi:hypothetical protein
MTDPGKQSAAAEQDVDVVAGMKALKEALGNEDLAKQVYADANALESSD